MRVDDRVDVGAREIDRAVDRALGVLRATALIDRRPVERVLDDVVGQTFSRSSTAPHLVGTRPAEFEPDLLRLSLDIRSPAGDP